MNEKKPKLKIFVYSIFVLTYIGLLANSIYRVYSGRNTTTTILVFLFLSHYLASLVLFAPSKPENATFRVLIKESKSRKDKNQHRKLKNKYKKRKQHNRRNALLIIPTAIILSICFVSLFLIQRMNSSGIIQTILSTGIHVPIIIYLGSLIIHAIHKAVLKHYPAGSEEIDDETLVKILYCLSFYLDMTLLLLDWTLGIYIAVIIIGRIIWFDTVYTGQVIETIKKLIHEIIHEKVILQITNIYGTILLTNMLLLIAFLQVFGN